MLKRAAEVTTICLKETQMDVYVKQSHSNQSEKELASGLSFFPYDALLCPFGHRMSLLSSMQNRWNFLERAVLSPEHLCCHTV